MLARFTRTLPSTSSLLAGRAAHLHVGVDIRRDDVARDRLRVFRRQLEVDGNMRLQDADGARDRHIAGCRLAP